MSESDESLDGEGVMYVQSYNDKLKLFRFPENFLETVEEKMHDGLDIYSSYGQTFFQTLIDADLLSQFEGRYDAQIRDYIRGVIDELEAQY